MKAIDCTLDTTIVRDAKKSAVVSPDANDSFFELVYQERCVDEHRFFGARFGSAGEMCEGKHLEKTDKICRYRLTKQAAFAEQTMPLLRTKMSQ